MLLAVPALRALHAEGGAERLILAAQPRLADLLRRLGVIDQALDFDGLGLHELFAGDPAPGRLPAVDAASRVVCWFAESDAGFVARLRARVPDLIVASPAPADGGSPVWAHLLASVGAKADGRWCRPLPVGEELLAAGRDALGVAGWDGAGPVLVVHPGAGGVAKRWPVEGFARILAALGERCAVAVHEGPADTAAVSALLTHHRGPVLRLVRPELGTLAGVLRQAVGYLGNDSGVSHLAAAVGVPAVVLFTAEKLAWVPWATGVTTPVVATDSLDPRDLDRVSSALSAQLP